MYFNHGVDVWLCTNITMDYCHFCMFYSICLVYVIDDRSVCFVRTRRSLYEIDTSGRLVAIYTSRDVDPHVITLSSGVIAWRCHAMDQAHCGRA
jgi:hypothetical protein